MRNLLLMTPFVIIFLVVLLFASGSDAAWLNTDGNVEMTREEYTTKITHMSDLKDEAEILFKENKQLRLEMNKILREKNNLLEKNHELLISIETYRTWLMIIVGISLISIFMTVFFTIKYFIY